MNFSETLIIYLACGAPFGVEYLQRRTDRSIFWTAFGVVVRFILWPISAGRMLFRLLACSSELLLESPDAVDQQLSAIRSRLKFAVIDSAFDGRKPRVSRLKSSN